MALHYPPFGPGAPVPANFLNDVRDHINARKHADVELMIPALAMSPLPGSRVALHADLYWRSTGGGFGTLLAPLALLAGTTVQAITVYGLDTPFAEFHAEMLRTPLDRLNPRPEIINNREHSSGHTGSATAIEMDARDEGFPFLVQPAYTYTLRVWMENAVNLAIYGARFVIRRD